MVGRVWTMVLLVAAVAACNTEVPLAEVEPGAGSPPGLGTTLTATVAADSVRLELHVTNVTDAPLALEFSSSQRYDFAVSRTDGEVLWRWSAAMLFAQMLGEEQLGPGETRRYAESWAAGALEGDHVATAWLTSTSHPVELRTVFRLPAP
jgi:hypothetical protein